MSRRATLHGVINGVHKLNPPLITKDIGYAIPRESGRPYRGYGWRQPTTMWSWLQANSKQSTKKSNGTLRNGAAFATAETKGHP